MAASRRPRFSVIIPSYNGAELLQSCLESLLDMHEPAGGHEWIVVDNGSTDGTVDHLRQRFPQVKVVTLPHNRGFAGAITAGVRKAEGQYVVFLNNDMRVSRDWLGAFEEALGQSGAPCATGKILDRTGTRIDFVQGLLLFDGHALQRYQGADATLLASWKGWRPTFIACGGNMAIRKDLYLALGGFDADFFAYTEDVDFSWRLHVAGHEIVFVPEAMTRHDHQATSNRFGPYRRGFLYERNAFWCLYKNIDPIFFHPMVHLAWVTLLHRTRCIAALHEPRCATWFADPFASAEGLFEDLSTVRQGRLEETGRAWTRWTQWLRKGLRSLEERGLRETLNRALRVLHEQRQAHGTARSQDPPNRALHPYILSQLQALWAITGGFRQLQHKRQKVQAQRKVSDHVLFEKFPPWVVTTYPGDEELLNAPWFRDQLPKEIPFRYGTLEDVHGNTAVQRHHPDL